MSNQFGSYSEAINILKTYQSRAKDAFFSVVIQNCIDEIKEAWEHEEIMFAKFHSMQEMRGLGNRKEDFEEVN